SKPADIAGAINATDRGAESSVKAGGSPAFRRIPINDRRNSAAVKSEFYLRLLVVERSITAPRSLEIRLFDWRAELRDESLHRDHLIYAANNGAVQTDHEDLNGSPQTITDSREFDCYTSVSPRTIVLWCACGQEPSTMDRHMGRRS